MFTPINFHISGDPKREGMIGEKSPILKLDSYNKTPPKNAINIKPTIKRCLKLVFTSSIIKNGVNQRNH